MDPELKALLEEQLKTFESFKNANDTMQAEIKGNRQRLDVCEKQVKEANNLAIEAAKLASRARLGGGRADDDAEAKSLDIFNGQRRSIFLEKRQTPPPELSDLDFLEYKRVYRAYLLHGDLALTNDANRKAMSVGIDPDGGYLVTPDMGGRMAKKLFESSPVRQVANVQPIASDALEGINDLNEVTAGWVSETGSRDATAHPQIGKYRIPAEEMYAMPEVTQKLLDDSSFPVENWLADKIGEKFGGLEATAFVTGDGVGKPRGFASYPTAATADATRAWGVMEHIVSGTNGAFGSDPNGASKLLALIHKIKAPYRAGASWMMNKTTLGAVRDLKDGNGRFVFVDSMIAGAPPQLLGYPVTEAEDMATYTTTGALAIAFGDFKAGYQIVDRIGTRLLRDPFTNKPYVRFYTTRRVGGDVVNFESIKFLKFST